MTVEEECQNLIKYGVLVRESMRRLTTEYGEVEEPFVDAVEKVVENGDVETALDVIQFSSQIAVKLDSDYIKKHIQRISNEFEETHTKCDVCGDIVHIDDAEDHIENHEVAQ